MTSFVIIIISVNFQLKQLNAKILPITISYSCSIPISSLVSTHCLPGEWPTDGNIAAAPPLSPTPTLRRLLSLVNSCDLWNSGYDQWLMTSSACAGGVCPLETLSQQWVKWCRKSWAWFWLLYAELRHTVVNETSPNFQLNYILFQILLYSRSFFMLKLRNRSLSWWDLMAS